MREYYWTHRLRVHILLLTSVGLVLLLLMAVPTLVSMVN